MRLFKALIAFALILPPIQSVAGIAKTNSGTFCYSAYHLQQQMKLTVNFGKEIQQQKVKLNINIHVREIPVSKKNLRSFIMLVDPDKSQVNDIAMGMSQRYQHPFLVLVDADSGELLDLKSSIQKESILSEYRSFFDLFQYSQQNGQYLYRNGNGMYRAEISTSDSHPNQIVRKNIAYLKANNDIDNKLQVEEGYLSFIPAKTQTECFYQKAKGVEILKKSLSKEAFIYADASLKIESDIKRALEPAHFFYTLTDKIEQWPTFKPAELLTEEQAFSRLPDFTARLSFLFEDDAKFLSEMLVDQVLWPHLSEYIMANGISNELSLKLIWALDRIDTTDSVNALAQLATSPLSDRDRLRAAIALASTSAAFSPEMVNVLKDRMAAFTNGALIQPEDLTFIRMLGAMANRRETTAPLQSSDIRQFLYTQAGTFDELVNATVIGAIGNLGSTIDEEGKEVLLRGLSSVSEKERLAATSAFSKVPYNQEYSSTFIEKLSTEKNIDIKNNIIAALSQADNSDLQVKHQLLSLVDGAKHPGLELSSLKSLKKIDYQLQPDDVQLLESKLSHETNSANQRLLAALILKQRRRQQNR